MGPSAFVEEQAGLLALSWSRTLTGPAMREAIDSLPGALRHISGYHFGWWDKHGNAESGYAGKALRPALVLLAAESVGGSAATALPAAIAVELVHNFSLMHDDVMDGDVTRRHRPTVWSVFGVGSAILTGDALLALAFEILAASGHAQAGEGTRMLSAAVADLLDGQGEDLVFEGRHDVTVAECLGMARKKTAALLQCSVGLGALFGDGTAAQVAHLRTFGAKLGLAFQIADDFLGIWGDPQITGKPVYSDLRSHKKSLPVVAALNSGSSAGARLADAYRDPAPLSDHDLGAMAELIEAAGGRSWCAELADELIDQAIESLHLAETQARTIELASLARLSARRDR
ncbi:MAG TPA: dimethylallyltranstransferase [Micromonosporaceae bacterium]|nr:dimethylallyltranstransferase [Micromonosporaceae bacterium]